jgi:hypothetical protein
MKKRRSFKNSALFLMVPVLISLTTVGGCATTSNQGENTQQSKVGEALSDHKETAIGATLLGIMGAGLGYALAGEKGAAIGGGSGLALGAGMGQLIEQKDKKRIEAVSESGHRPEQDDNETTTNVAGGTESEEGQHLVERNPMVAVADISGEANVNPISKQSNETVFAEREYDIVRNGKVIGSIILDDNSSDTRPLSTGSLSLFRESSDACARLELRKR